MSGRFEKNTNTTKRKGGSSKFMIIFFYVVVWLACVIFFWLVNEIDAIGYSVFVLWITLPAATIAASALAGKNFETGKKWLWCIFFAVMYMLAEYCSFSLANMVAFDKVNMPDFTCLVIGAMFSLVGMICGHIASKK